MISDDNENNDDWEDIENTENNSQRLIRTTKERLLDEYIKPQNILFTNDNYNYLPMNHNILNNNTLTKTKYGRELLYKIFNNLDKKYFKEKTKLGKSLRNLLPKYSIPVEIFAPTIYTISLCGKYKLNNNVIPLSLFKENEIDSLKRNNVWNCFNEIYNIKELFINNLKYNIKHIISPDLSALRNTVKIDLIKQNVQEVLLMKQFYLLFYTFYNNDVTFFKKLINDDKFYKWCNIIYNYQLNNFILLEINSLPNNFNEFFLFFNIFYNELILLEIIEDLKPLWLVNNDELIVCPKCFYTWNFKDFYFKYPNLYTGICIVHALNRILLSIINITLNDNIEDIRFFASLFGKNSVVKEMENKNIAYESINGIMKEYINKIEWPKQELTIKEFIKKDSNNDINYTHYYIRQLLFKMTDKIICTFELWKNYFEKYLQQRELEDNCNNYINFLLNQQAIFLNIKQRGKFDKNIQDLWFNLQHIWIILKSSTKQWKEWKKDSYIYIKNIFNNFINNIYINTPNSKGLADYIHIVCNHLIDYFEEFNISPIEYQNIDTESIHYSQNLRNKETSLNGGCNSDEFIDLFVRELKILLCRDTLENLHNIYNFTNNNNNLIISSQPNDDLDL
ncbi:hypothetical protein ABK040_006614 [Willaertia magna]